MRRLAAGLVVLGLLSSSAFAVIIDNFEAGTTLLLGAPVPNGNPATLNQGSLPVGDVIGGVRDTFVQNLTVGGLNVTAQIYDPAPPPLDYILDLSSAGTEQGLWRLAYGVTVGGAAPGDLTVGNATHIVFWFEYADAGAQVDMYASDGTNFDTETLFTLGPGFLSFAFAGFTGVDFTNIQDLSFTVTGNEAGDYGIRLLETRENPDQRIPEPGTIALLCLGLAGLARRRRRKS